MPRIDYQQKLDFNQVLITPKRSNLNSRSEVALERTFTFKNGQTWTGVPIICANMSSTGTFEVYDVLREYKMITALHKFYQYSDYAEHIQKCDEKGAPMDFDYCMVSIGIGDHEYDKLENLCELLPIKWICIDIANGYIPKFLEFCKKVRARFPDKILVAGNVATPDMVNTLCLEGDVDIIKCGIGPGSACTTRLKTGVGIPQLSCIMDCGDAAHGVNKYIVGDGGITCPGDLSKAFCAGADFVMMGGVFAGHDENPGELIQKSSTNGIVAKYKLFYGMSSTHAMMKFYGKKDDYRASEGKVVEIPYKGKLKDTLEDYLGGVRSTCTYIGSKCIKHMPKCTTFVLTSQQLNNIFKS
jgi:GMP reductase|tara:strand:- start:7518 stop:8585 length:1068 start_codon:yes stop_codon:yes gene_type:complete